MGIPPIKERSLPIKASWYANVKKSSNKANESPGTEMGVLRSRNILINEDVLHYFPLIRQSSNHSLKIFRKHTPFQLDCEIA